MPTPVCSECRSRSTRTQLRPQRQAQPRAHVGYPQHLLPTMATPHGMRHQLDAAPWRTSTVSVQHRQCELWYAPSEAGGMTTVEIAPWQGDTKLGGREQ